MDNLQKILNRYKVENLTFLIPLKPIRGIRGIFTFTYSKDEYKKVMCKILKVDAEIYTFKSLEKGYGKRKLNKFQLLELISKGEIQVYYNINNEITK